MAGEPNAAAYWQSSYEDEDFPRVAEELYQQIKPLFEQLHAYVRRKLYQVYGPKYINLKGPIPAHLVGTWRGGDDKSIQLFLYSTHDLVTW